MNEELIPADLNLLPIGSVIPMEKGKVPEEFEAFDGRTLDSEDVPELAATLRMAPDSAIDLLIAWGGEFLHEQFRIKLPDLDSETVMNMIWGVKIEGAPELVLAIKAKAND